MTRPSASKPACSTSRNSSIDRSLVKNAGCSPVPRIARSRSAAPAGRLATDPGVYSGIWSPVSAELLAEPALQRLSSLLCTLELHVEREAKLLEKGIDVHRRRFYRDAADDLLPARLERSVGLEAQQVRVVAERQPERRDVSADQGAPHLDVRAEAGEHFDELLEQRNLRELRNVVEHAVILAA